MYRCKKRMVEGSWHRAQGKENARGDGIDYSLRVPFALRLVSIIPTSRIRVFRQPPKI